MSKKYTNNRTKRKPLMRANYYSFGADLKNNIINAFTDYDNLYSIIGSGAEGLSPMIYNRVSGGLNSGIGNTVKGLGEDVGNVASSIPLIGGLLEGAVKGATSLIGGGINKLVGSKLNAENIARIENANNVLGNTVVDASSLDSIQRQFGVQDFGQSFTRKDIGKDGLFSNKAKNKFRRLQQQQDIAASKAFASYLNAIDTADTQSDLNLLAQSFADGGKIYIKPSKRGTFTAAAKKRGMGVQEFASKVLANKDDYSSAMVKKANFAKNASKWHAEGGPLQAYGADWNNGITIIGNGGTHEQNPMEGVQMGVDFQGIPNLVEEGEVIFNDYVFSNRLTVPEGVRKQYKLRGDKKLTFADAAKQMQKESEERPNDPISKRGLMSAMARLQQAQEAVREDQQVGLEGVKYGDGGPLDELLSGFNARSTFQFENPDDDYLWKSVVDDYGPESSYKPQRRASLVKTQKPLSGNEDVTSRNLSWLRYAPVVGATIGLGENLFSEPDYTEPSTLLAATESASKYTPIIFDPVGNYLTYNPFDRDYYINKLNAQAGATRRAILNSTSPSRNAALLAADYNAQGRLGDLARQAEEYNLAQRQAVETFNRATNMTNAELGLKAAIANQEAELNAGKTRLSGVAQAIGMRDAINARRAASRNANLSNFFNSLGDIGREEFAKNMILSDPSLYYSIDTKTGKITYKNGFDELSEAAKKQVRRDAEKAKKKQFKD